MNFLVKYLAVFLVGLVVSWLLVPLVKKIAPSLGLVDEPDERRIHKIPIPRCGGIAVFIATHVAMLLIFVGPWAPLSGAVQLKEWGLLFVGSLALLLVGIFDDRFDMKAWFKLLGQLAVSLLMFLGGFSFGSLLHIELPLIIDLGITLFWFALLINAFNLIDGMDGACAGLGLIASAGLAGMLISLGQISAALVLIALVGACLGFLRYNFNPASIFLGDCGSMFIGFMLAAIALKANVKQSAMVAVLVPFLAVGVPIFDVMMAVWRRLARKLVSMIRNDGLATKIFGPDLDHVHHKLLRSGMSQKRAAIAMYVAAIFICVVAICATAMTSNRMAVLMVGMIVVLHVMVRKMAQIELWTTTQVVLQGVRRPKRFIGVAVAVLWDILCLYAATAFVFGIVITYPLTLPLTAVCLMIPFLTIYFYGTYKTVWSRSRISQILVLFLQLTAGEVLAFVALIWVTDLDHTALLIALSQHILGAAVGIVGIRASLHLVRDLGAWLRCAIANDEGYARSLILGAGENAILYLRQASFADQQRAPRKVIGLVDDNDALLGRMVYGYPVLGEFAQLEEIIRQNKVSELIFTHHYSDELRAAILELKSKYNLKIRDFVFVMRDLDETGTCIGMVKPYSVDETDCRNLCSRFDAACPSETGCAEAEESASIPVP